MLRFYDRVNDMMAPKIPDLNTSYVKVLPFSSYLYYLMIYYLNTSYVKVLRGITDNNSGSNRNLNTSYVKVLPTQKQILSWLMPI